MPDSVSFASAASSCRWGPDVPDAEDRTVITIPLHLRMIACAALGATVQDDDRARSSRKFRNMKARGFRPDAGIGIDRVNILRVKRSRSPAGEPRRQNLVVE